MPRRGLYSYSKWKFWHLKILWKSGWDGGCLKLEILSGGGVWQFWKSGRKEGSKKRAFRRGGVDFFWNNPTLFGVNFNLYSVQEMEHKKALVIRGYHNNTDQESRQAYSTKHRKLLSAIV